MTPLYLTPNDRLSSPDENDNFLVIEIEFVG